MFRPKCACVCKLHTPTHSLPVSFFLAVGRIEKGGGWVPVSFFLAVGTFRGKGNSVKSVKRFVIQTVKNISKYPYNCIINPIIIKLV